MYTDCHWHNPNLSERDSIIHNRGATTHGVPSYKDTLIWFGDEGGLSANITKKLSNAKGYGRFGWMERRVRDSESSDAAKRDR